MRFPQLICRKVSSTKMETTLQGTFLLLSISLNKATTHGFQSDVLFQNAWGLFDVMIIIQTSVDYVFAIYLKCVRQSRTSFEYHYATWFISLINPNNRAPFKTYVSECEIRSYLNDFAIGNILHLYDYSNLDCRSKLQRNLNADQKSLDFIGNDHFSTKEIEVYTIKQ